MSYPTIMTDRLASGKPLVGMSPLLVSSSGVNLIPDGTSKAHPYSKKAVVSLGNGVYTSNKGSTWANSGTSFSPAVSNSVTVLFSTGNVFLQSYTSSNPVANITTPKAVQQVGNYVVATNSHSVYRGANLTQLLGKVAVGNGVKGLESKVVENINIGYDFKASDGTVSNSQYKIVYVDIHYTEPSYIGRYFRFIVSYTGNVSLPNRNYGGSEYEEVLNIATTPQHSTIDLDNSKSPAIKTLSTIATADDGELLYQVFGEEIVGTGDTGSFSQLTNGTKADWNGTTVKTVCATIGTGVYK